MSTTVATTRPAAVASEFRRGWPAVLACFWVAVFAWGFGFYGQAVYLAELQRAHGWPASLISAATTCFYLAGAGLMAFVHHAIERFGPRVVMTGGVVTLGLGASALSHTTAPWQMFACGLLMAVGWAHTTTTAIATTLSLWFDTRRGLAISLALNGASAGGFTIAPLLVQVSHAIGFAAAVPAAALAGAALAVPLVVIGLRRPPSRAVAGARPAHRTGVDEGVEITRSTQALRHPRFWSIAAPFALALAAQVGFIVHEVAFLLPLLGTAGTGIAFGATSFAAMAGRLVLGTVIDRLNQRLASAACFLSQAAGLGLLLALPNQPVALYAGSIIFGLSVGNVITLPSLLVQRNFASRSFGLVLGLTTATGQFALALAPGVFGALHDATGGYAPVLIVCIVLQCLAALGILRWAG